jgi:ParB/RepB/Spo0J family partition protein
MKVKFNSIDLDDRRFCFRDAYPQEGLAALATNISKHGLQNPVKLRLRPDGRHQVLAGWRRILAIMLIGWPEVDALVYRDISDEVAQDINVIDNAFRSELNDVEKAEQVRVLREKQGYPVRVIADLIGVGDQRVYDLLTLAGMPAFIKQHVIDGSLTLYHVVELGKLPGDSMQGVADRAVRERWSVKRLRLERGRDPVRVVGDPAEMAYDAVRVAKTPEALDYFRLRLPLMRGVPAPFVCEYSCSELAREEAPPNICHKEIEWAVLAPPNYYHHNEKYRGGEVPFGSRNAWAFLCEEHAVKLYRRVRFHDGVNY